MPVKRRGISIWTLLFALTAIPAISQVNTYSPYTRFGLGNLSLGGFTQNQAMGGTGIAIRDNNKLNYLNPAAYAARDSMSVLLDFGMTGYINQYESGNISNRWYNGNFNHIALSLPVGKFIGIGTGIVPFSSVGYNILQEYNDLGTGDALDYYHSGNGGIMKYFAGASVLLFNRVSIGLNMNFLLGDITRERSITFPRNRGFAETKSVEKINISNSYFSLGVQYKETVSEKFYFAVGGTYDLPANFSSAFKSTVTNYFPGSPDYLNDSIVIYPEFDIRDDEAEQPIRIPAKIGFGLAAGIPGKLTVTGDYYMQDWTSVDNSSLNEEGFNLAAAKSMHAGIEYTPDFEAFRGYQNLISYRLGGYINESYVMVGDYQLKDYGITFGVGLPMGRTMTSLNVAFTLGTRGTLENNLVKENYGIITFSLTLHDRWFYKRKFE